MAPMDLGRVLMFGTFRTSLSNKMLMQDEQFFLIELARIWLIIQAERSEPRMHNRGLNW